MMRVKPISPQGGLRGVTMRPACPGDRAFVTASWHRSYRSSPWARALSPQVYDIGQQELIAALWIRASVVVAHPEDTPEVILGWACGGSGLLHYVYVKGELRSCGLGTALVEHLGDPPVYTHQTSTHGSLVAGRIYNPYRR